MTKSEELIARAIVAAASTTHKPTADIIIELAKEYEIAIAQNLRLEESIHVLCKRID